MIAPLRWSASKGDASLSGHTGALAHSHVGAHIRVRVYGMLRGSGADSLFAQLPPPFKFEFMRSPRLRTFLMTVAEPLMDSWSEEVRDEAHPHEEEGPDEHGEEDDGGPPGVT